MRSPASAKDADIARVNLRAQMGTAAVAIAVAVAGTAPAAAEAKTIPHLYQVSALVPARLWQPIGHVPIIGMERLGTQRVRSGGDTYRGMWANALTSRGTLAESLREMRRMARIGNSHIQGVYGDRRLTRAESRHFQVLVDLARDADVLVVKRGHPACEGLTLAEARALAAGRVTRWSEVGAAPSGAADEIALRHVVNDGMFEPRFGVTKKPRAAKGARDGGVAEAAQNASVAAISAWTRVRYRSGVCVVPIDDVAPTDVTVHALSYKGAYPVTFIAPRKRPRGALPRATMRLYVKWLKSAAAAKLFRGNGLILAADKPQPPPTGPGTGAPGTGGGPAFDALGRPITPTRDDAGALAALEGERLERSPEPPAYFRIAFEPNGVLNVPESGDGQTCQMSTGRWSVIEGWRYGENGGGYVIRVRFEFEQASESTIELPNDSPGIAYYDGQQWTRSRALAGSC